MKSQKKVKNHERIINKKQLNDNRKELSDTLAQNLILYTETGTENFETENFEQVLPKLKKSKVKCNFRQRFWIY